MDKTFINKSLAKFSILAILFNILSTSFFTSTTFGGYSQSFLYTHTNSIGTMTGVSSFSTQTGTFDYLYSGNNQDKVNTVTGTKLDFSFELSDIYSGALIDYAYFTSTGTAPVASGSYIYTGGSLQVNNNIDLLLNGTSTGFFLTLTGLVNGMYHIGVIPGNGENFEEKVIDYEFVVGDIGITQKTGEIGFIAIGDMYSQGQAFTGNIVQNNINLFMSGVNFTYDSYNLYYNTGGENILFFTGIYNGYPANRINVDLKNIPAELNQANLVVGLVSSGSEYKTAPYQINFDTSLPVLNPIVTTLSGELSLSGKKVLMGTGQGMHYWIKFNERLIDNLSYKIDGVEASFSGTKDFNPSEGCILGTGGLTYGTYGAGNISISWSQYGQSCPFAKNYINGTNGETHTITLYGTDKLGRELTPTNIVYTIDESIQDSNVKVVPLDYQVGESQNGTTTQSGISIGQCSNTNGCGMGGTCCVGNELVNSCSGMINYNSPELHLDSAISMISTSDFANLGNTLTGVQFITIGTGAYTNTTCPINNNLIWLDQSYTGTCSITFAGTNETYFVKKSSCNKYISSATENGLALQELLLDCGGDSGTTPDNYQSGIILSATGGNISYSDNQSLPYNIDFLLSGATISSGKTLVVDLEGGQNFSVTGSVNLSNLQSTGTLSLDLTNKFTNFTGSKLRAHVMLFASGKSINNHDMYESLYEFDVNFVKNTIPVSFCGNGVKDVLESCDPNDITHSGWGDLGCSLSCTPSNSSSGGGGPLYQTGIINIIDSTHISLSGSLDFLGSQSWEVLDTFGPPTHYIFTESGSNSELSRISYNTYTGTTLSFQNSMSGKTIQIWGDFSSVGCQNTETGSCQKIKLTTSGIGFNSGSFTFPGEQTPPSSGGAGGGGGCGRNFLASPTLTYTGETLVNQNSVIISGNTPSCGPDIVAFYNNGNYIGTGIVNRSNTTQTGIINYEVQLNEGINNITAKEVSGTGLSESSNIISITKNSSYQIATPTNVSLTGITQTGGTLSWIGTGGVDSYEIYLNGIGITTVSSGNTSYTFDTLEAGKVYYVGLKAVKGNIKSSLVERRLETLGNNLSFNITFDNECIEIGTGSYKDWMSLNISGSGFYYNSYASKEINSTTGSIVFNNVSNGDYTYSIWAGKCGYQTGTVSVNGPTNKNISVSAGKWIKTIVRENTLTGNIISNYNIELTPNTSNFNWNDAKYVYVNSITGTVLNLGNDDYNLKLRDNSWVAKNIIGVYTGTTSDTNISSNSILTNSSYSSGDTLTVVVQEGNILVGTANIGDGYITLYNSGTNTWVASASIRNGKFAMMGIPSGNYKIESYSYNYKYNNYEEYLNIASDITNKNITFTQKNLDLSADFSKSFALEGKTISLKINPNQNNTGALSFASGSEIFSNAKYKVLNNSGVLVSSGIISNLDSTTDFTSIAGKTITVDLTLKNDINSEIKFVKSNFGQLELSLPIVRIEYSSPATTLANTDFVIRGSASSNVILQAMYNGTVISTGSANLNGAFEMIAKIDTAGSGNIIVKDVTNNLLSDGSNISVGSDLPILSSYDIKVDNVSKASSSEAKIKYFSLWAKGDLTSASDLEISTTISNSPSIKYYIGGIEALDGKLAKGTYVGYGTKDVVVEYTKNGITYTQTIAKMIVLIDPAGYVYNKYDNLKIPGIQATLYELQDKNGNRVTATGGVDMTKIAQYTSSGYTKDDLVNTISACSGGGDLYPCSWVKYDSTGLGEEPNPQITDSEGRYAWQTPDGFYYVKFEDIDGNTNGSYDTFESLAVIIPPEVTDLNVGSDYSSGYTITETATNYYRSKSWTGTGFTSWSYTCKNSYTGNICETAPVVQQSSGGGGGYTPPKPTITQTGATNTGATSTGNIVTIMPNPVISITDKNGVTSITKTDGKIVKVSDISKSFAKIYIENLIRAGIVNGYSDNTFKPEQFITRAEYLKMVLNANNIDYSNVDTKDISFIDIDKNSWQAKVVKRATMLGIISKENIKFRPNDSISRAESMKILMKASNIEVKEITKSSFSDVSGIFVKYIELAKNLGIISKENIKFRPNDSISRAEVSKIIFKNINVK